MYYIYVPMAPSLSIHIYIHIDIHIYIYLFIFLSIYICISMYIHVYIYIYIYMHINIIYIYILYDFTGCSPLKQSHFKLRNLKVWSGVAHTNLHVARSFGASCCSGACNEGVSVWPEQRCRLCSAVSSSFLRRHHWSRDLLWPTIPLCGSVLPW